MKTITVYTFNELLALQEEGVVSTNVVEKARQWLREYNTAHEWWESTYDVWKEALAQIGFENAEINFSGFCCQGDGASFTADIDLEKLADFLSGSKTTTELPPREIRCHTNPAYKRLRSLSYWLGEHKVERTSRRYSHENTCGVCLSLSYCRQVKRVEKLMDELRKDAEELRVNLCRAIYRDLEAEYEYLTSDEAIMEFADDFTFTTHGTREG